MKFSVPSCPWQGVLSSHPNRLVLDEYQSMADNTQRPFIAMMPCSPSFCNSTYRVRSSGAWQHSHWQSDCFFNSYARLRFATGTSLDFLHLLQASCCWKKHDDCRTMPHATLATRGCWQCQVFGSCVACWTREWCVGFAWRQIAHGQPSSGSVEHFSLA